LQHVLPRPGDLSRVTHFRALPFLEVPRLMQQLATHEGSAAKALQFLISTATRAGEVLGAIWDEIDFEAATWLVPPSRMKSRREFRVPLSKEALALLDNLPREPNNPYLFIGSKPGAGLSETSLAAALRRVGCDATPHGFRSSFSDWAHERSTFSNHEIELSLAHSIGSDVERAYRRGDILDRRRRLMAAWSKFICTPPPAAGAVVPMRGAR
jgi:integrase